MTEKEYIEKLEKQTKMINRIKETTRRNFQDMVNLLTSTISISSPYLGGHLRRVAENAKDLADQINEDKEEAYSVYYAGLLHDIGLLGMTEDVISKSSSEMTEEEFNEYRKHPETSESIISTVYDLKRICKIIRHHHEDLNGNGYPDGISGEAIPQGARILRIVNDYDNLLYKDGLSETKAVKSLQNGAGSLYDPEILERFVNHLRSCGLYSDAEEEKVKVSELSEGQFILDDIYLENGMLLIPRGVFLNSVKMKKITAFSSLVTRDYTVRVRK
ncbi:MAG: HD domain-containing protein [Spirochaetales bacterium]|nr:HD domain-containing protein [Spirochaetales bacterium]